MCVNGRGWCLVYSVCANLAELNISLDSNKLKFHFDKAVEQLYKFTIHIIIYQGIGIG